VYDGSGVRAGLRVAMAIVLLGAATAAGVVGQPAPRAPGPGPSGSAFGPCSDEAKRLCGAVKPGQGRMYRCLEQKEAEVSAPCKEHLQQRRAEFREAQGACKQDIEKFCREIRPGQGRVASCLKSHEAELSPPCRGEVRGR